MSVTATGTNFISTRPTKGTGNKSYLIPVGELFPMITAYNPSNPNLSYHGLTNHMNLAIFLPSSGGCSFEVVEPVYKTAKIHGYIMWFTWTVVGLA